MSARYRVLPPTAPVPAPDDLLEATAREGARRMLARTLEIEREEFLDRVHYQRGADFHDESVAWFNSIEDISNQLKMKGRELALQIDVTATVASVFSQER